MNDSIILSRMKFTQYLVTPSMAVKTTSSSLLELSLSQIGLEEYFETLVSHGFDTWEDLAGISEETLAELGMRLGHRRKLQREIASSRGQPRTKPLFPADNIDGESEESDEESSSPHVEDSTGMKTEAMRVKRRYRHRERKDPYAPRRPSCAYVLFGNYLRQQPEIAELSFVEISKLVGERWQQLSSEERRTWTSTVAEQKSKYMMELAEYQKSQRYQDHQELLRTLKRKQQEKRVLAGKLSVQTSTEDVSTSPSWKGSSVTMSASDDGSYSLSGRRGSRIFSFESPPSGGQVSLEDENLDSANRCKEEHQFMSSVSDTPRQDSICGVQIAMLPQRNANFAVDCFQFENGSTISHHQRGFEKHKSYHTQVLNPFRMISGTETWQMLESYLQKVNNFYYCVNAELLVQQFHIAMDQNSDLPNQVLCTLCLCISIGCQTHPTGTDEMAIMWYENGRRYLDDDDWGWNLDVMRALSLISIFHRSRRPTTSRHYLDLALRIGEANNLSTQLNNTLLADWLLIWRTIRQMAGLASIPLGPT